MMPNYCLIALILPAWTIPAANAQVPASASAAPSVVVRGQVQRIFLQAARGLLIEVGHTNRALPQQALWADVKIEGSEAAVAVRLQDGQRIDTNTIVKVRLATAEHPRAIGIREQSQIVAVLPARPVVAAPAIVPPRQHAASRDLLELAVATEVRTTLRPTAF